jgi:hypothetical protein
MVGSDASATHLGHRSKREDTAAGCRQMAQDDRARAAEVGSHYMRDRLEISAVAWIARASLLERLDANFSARASANAGTRQRRTDTESSD